MLAQFDPEPEAVPSWDGWPCPLCGGVRGRCSTWPDGSFTDCVSPLRGRLRDRPYRKSHPARDRRRLVPVLPPDMLADQLARVAADVAPWAAVAPATLAEVLLLLPPVAALRRGLQTVAGEVVALKRRHGGQQ